MQLYSTNKYTQACGCIQSQLVAPLKRHVICQRSARRRCRIYMGTKIAVELLIHNHATHCVKGKLP
jgi:hypothetical protein